MSRAAVPVPVEVAPGGCHLSPLVQGYWRLCDWGWSAKQTLKFLQAHVDLGITSVDHADIYGDYRCQARFGEALRLKPALRETLQIVSKCGIKLRTEACPERRTKHYDCSADQIMAAVEQSLADLGTDRLDLLLLHRPDLLLDVDEAAEAFERLRRDGKVLHFGVSNFSPAQFELLQSRLDWPLETNQVEINPLSLARLPEGTLEQAQRLRRRPMAWSCLAGGEVFNERCRETRELRQALTEVGEEFDGADPVTVLIAWVLRLPSRPLPVLGSRRIERTRAALQALELRLGREAWYRILEAARGREVS